ncbi:MAG: prophage regulatory protein [Pseudomonadota bacterium]|nr:prophage regulatory protein [Pseudomonadota bacterium]
MDETTTEALIRRQDVERITGMSRSAIWERLNPSSRYFDPEFPKPVSLGCPNSVRWVKSEVSRWVHKKIEISRAKPATRAPRGAAIRGVRHG